MFSTTSRRRAPLLIALCATILSGCATMTGFGATEPPPDPRAIACGAFRPIGWSTRDTEQTIREVKSHNAAWRVVCAEPKPAAAS